MRNKTFLFWLAMIALSGGCSSANESGKPNSNANLSIASPTALPSVSPKATVNAANSPAARDNQKIGNTNRTKRDDRDEDEREEKRSGNKNSREPKENEREERER